MTTPTAGILLLAPAPCAADRAAAATARAADDGAKDCADGAAASGKAKPRTDGGAPPDPGAAPGDRPLPERSARAGLVIGGLVGCVAGAVAATVVALNSTAGGMHAPAAGCVVGGLVLGLTFYALGYGAGSVVDAVD